MRYAFILQHRKLWPVTAQCRVLEVSRQRLSAISSASDGHRHPSTRPPARRCGAAGSHQGGLQRDEERLKWRELQARGIRAGKERVRKLMKVHGLCARGKRKFKATTNSAHDLPVSPNLLERKFSVDTPNRVWTGDITYLWTEEGWVYLAVVIDLFSRQIVGFAMSERMTRRLVIDALRMAWFRRRPTSGLIFHSDRGSQYASGDFRKQLSAFGMRGSISRKGNCWDNGVTETLFGFMKVERLHGNALRQPSSGQRRSDRLAWLL